MTPLAHDTHHLVSTQGRGTGRQAIRAALSQRRHLSSIETEDDDA
jgi:hypothetical protein